MFIYIDESGSFVQSPSENSWNVVAAFVVPEPTKRRAEESLRRLKLSAGRSHSEEIKLKSLSEGLLESFLAELGELNSTVFVSCIDLGLQDQAGTVAHKQMQAEKIRENIPRMIYPEGRQMIEDLATRVERLSPQLYTQMVVQIDLLDQVYRSSTLYYAQRAPPTLSSFRWRIDEKNSSRPQFEETMRHMASPMLQTMSLQDPAIFVREFDYSHFDRSFRFGPGEMPTYLEEETGIEIGSGSDLAKLLRDFQFVRSHDVPGVQIADLLASSFRRALRNEFENRRGIAKRLGRLTIQRSHRQPPIHLLSLAKEERSAHADVVGIVNSMKAVARPMLR